MKVTVNGALCTGHGRCYSLAPDVFEPDDEGYNLERDVPIDVPAEHEESARLAAHACPEGAISMAES
ncbi:ferredoxin [Pseudonocardia sp. NPDC049154]|uniref:ferredoxin n=1 Tax=Pseudonocardia sp. NPDC049154 TaxID=3155501 RepID=UPI00340493BF